MANSIDGTTDTYLEWLGFVESQLFIFLNLVAKQQEIQEIRAYPHSFKNKNRKDYLELGLMDFYISKFTYVDTYFMGFKLHKFASDEINIEDHAV